VRSTPRLGIFGVNRYRLGHRCVAISRVQATAAAAVLIKDGFKFLCFAQRLKATLRNGEVRTEYWNWKSVVD
jgi:hypothetical protein